MGAARCYTRCYTPDGTPTLGVLSIGGERHTRALLANALPSEG
jgi:hypothetical protein